MTTKYVTLPLFPDPYYSYPISLEGVSYKLDFQYNERAKSYFLSLYLADGTPLVLVEALVPSYPILKDYAIAEMSGFIWLEVKSNLQSEPYKEYPDQIDKYYNLYYIYNTED